MRCSRRPVRTAGIRIFLSAILVGVILHTGTPALAQSSSSVQSVEGVVEQMRAQYQRWTNGLRTLTTISTVHESVVPFDSVVTFQERTSGGSEPTYETTSRILGGREDLPPELHGSARVDFLTTYREIYRLFEDSTRYVGTETLGGEQMHVLEVSQLTSFYRELMAGGGGSYEMDARNGRFYVDADDWTVRQVEMDVVIQRRDSPHTVQAVTTLSDYRTVDGLTYPSRIETVMNNMVSPSERKRMKERVAEIEKQLESLPEQRRAQMEKTMGGQLERMRQLMDGSVEMAIQIEHVEINGPRPSVLEES